MRSGHLVTSAVTVTVGSLPICVHIHLQVTDNLSQFILKDRGSRLGNALVLILFPLFYSILC